MTASIFSRLIKSCDAALRDALIAGLTVLVISAITGFVVYNSASKALKSEVQNGLLNIAVSASNFLEGDLHQQITQPNQKYSELYEKTRAPFFNFLKANPNIAFMYTVVPKDKKIFFILDSKIFKQGEKDDTSDVMEEYTDATDTMKRAIAEKRPLVEEESYTDEWGTFLSAYAPIYNSKKEFLGVIGADIRLTDYLAQLSKIYHALMLAMGLSAVASIGVGVSVWFARKSAIRADISNREQQMLMAEMEKNRLVEQGEMQRVAEEQKKTAMQKMAKTFEDTVSDVVAQVVSRTAIIQSGIKGVEIIVSDTKERSRIVAEASDEAAEMSIQVTNAADKLTHSGNEIAVQAQTSTRVATEAAATAKSAQDIIQSLSEKSDKVGQIIEVITTIAGQINMLSLNATIEAARAGEAGKGFSVVAGEVKNLAAQVSQAAKEITQQVGNMQEATESSVEAVEKIITIIESVSISAETVAHAVQAQTEATNAIADNISRASRGTQKISQEILSVQEGADKTGDTAKEVLHSVAELGEQSDLLKQKMDEFVRIILSA